MSTALHLLGRFCYHEYYKEIGAGGYAGGGGERIAGALLLKLNGAAIDTQKKQRLRH